jgi:UDP-N-acetylglucosamine 4,6-dehydratase
MNKILLITGGTGSFGTAVLNRFLNSDEFKEIRILSRDEKKQDDMRKKISNDKVKFYIGDVRDYSSLIAAVDGSDFIFHAAALKQVPSCEFFPLEAVKTNIFGTENVLNAAIAYKVKKVVVLSTDKAAYPINAMGISKAMMEKIMIAKSRNIDMNGPVFCATRYGNVMASRGSVIPLLIDKIQNNLPLTITDESMTRFMMTLDDAVDLVLYAFKNGNQGDIFIQKSPASDLKTLSKALLQLYKSDVEIKIIGTRHGEKLYETLVTREEMAKSIDLGNYYRIPADNRDLNYDNYFINGKSTISNFDDYHSHNTTQLNVEELIGLLLKLPIVQNDLK